MIKLKSLLSESIEDTKTWYHGSPSGDLRGGSTGLHLGTFKAAKQALEARIGIKADGSEWDGTQEYGKSLLSGKATLKQKNIFPTGFNCDVPEEDFYPTDPHRHTSYLTLTMKPAIKAYKLTCPIFNKRPYTDNFANNLMKRLKKTGKISHLGFYYKNDGEDAGNISVVVPDGSCVKEI